MVAETCNSPCPRISFFNGRKYVQINERIAGIYMNHLLAFYCPDKDSWLLIWQLCKDANEVDVQVENLLQRKTFVCDPELSLNIQYLIRFRLISTTCNSFLATTIVIKISICFSMRHGATEIYCYLFMWGWLLCIACIGRILLGPPSASHQQPPLPGNYQLISPNTKTEQSSTHYTAMDGFFMVVY